MELTDREAVYAWIDAESGNLPAVVRQAALAGADDITVGLAAALFFPLYERGRWRELLVISELGADAADRLGDPHSRAITHGDLGYAQADHGLHGEAVKHLRQSLAEFRRIGNRRGEAAQLDRLGVVYSRQGRYEEAISYFRSSLELESGRGNRFGEAITLTNLGLTYQRAAQFDQALAAHLASLAISRDIEDPVGQAIAMGNAAEAHRRAKRPDEAAAYYRRALQQDRASGNQGTYTEAVHWWGLATTMTDLGEEAEALQCRRTSASILHRLALITAAERSRIDSGQTHDVPQIIARNQ
jgi:tetratricopeptide (TPR) repeat protein